jgi:hypothetical protein
MHWVLRYTKVALRLKKWADEKEGKVDANAKFIKRKKCVGVAKHILIPFYLIFTAVNAFDLFTIFSSVTAKGQKRPEWAKWLWSVMSFSITFVDGLLAAVFVYDLIVIWRYLSKYQKTRPSEFGVVLLGVACISFWLTSII